MLIPAPPPTLPPEGQHVFGIWFRGDRLINERDTAEVRYLLVVDHRTDGSER